MQLRTGNDEHGEDDVVAVEGMGNCKSMGLGEMVKGGAADEEREEVLNGR